MGHNFHICKYMAYPADFKIFLAFFLIFLQSYQSRLPHRFQISDFSLNSSLFSAPKNTAQKIIYYYINKYI